MPHYHAVAWLDHSEAHVLHFTPEDVENKLVHGKPHQHLHHKSGSQASGHAAEDPAFFRKIAEALAGAQEILLVGPASAKTAFFKYLDDHAPDLHEKVVAVETVDHPSYGQLLDYARKHFRASDRMRAQ